MATEEKKTRKTYRTEANEVSINVYCSLVQKGRIREVAKASYGDNASRALLGRFEEIDELTILPVHLRSRLEAIAKKAGLTNRDYVIKVLSDHTYAMPDLTTPAAGAKKGAAK